MNGKFYVYEHWRTDRGECFYVGKGHGRRAYDMRRGRNRWHKFLQAKLSALGTAIEVKIIADGLSERDAFDIEVERIAFWKNDGADLCNLTIGGDGRTGLKHTEEWKRANSERMKGRKWTAEARAKMSESMKGNKNGRGGKGKRTPEMIAAFVARCSKKTPEQIARMAASRKGKPTPWLFTPEAREKSGAAQRGKPKSDAARRKMSKPKSAAHVEKTRAAANSQWADPAYREKHKLAMKAWHEARSQKRMAAARE